MTDHELDFSREEDAFRDAFSQAAPVESFRPLDPDQIRVRVPAHRRIGWGRGLAAAAAVAVVIGGVGIGLSQLARPELSVVDTAAGGGAGEGPVAPGAPASIQEMGSSPEMDESSRESGSWTVVSAPPLSPRKDPAFAYTPAGYLVVGGQTAAGERLSDGAIFDPQALSWRPISAAPVGLFGLSGVSVGPKTYFAPVIGPGRTLMLSYDQEGDTWEELPLLTPTDKLLAVGGTLFNFSAGSTPEALSRWDATTRRWQPVVADPLPEGGLREAVATTAGVVVTRTDPGVPGRMKLAVWAPEAGTWRTLSDANFAATNPVAGADQVVWSLSGATGDVRPGHEQDVRVLNLTEDSWKSLPPSDIGTGVAGLQSGSAGRWVALNGQLLDPSSLEWLDPASLPGADQLPQDDGTSLVIVGKSGLLALGEQTTTALLLRLGY